MIVKRSFAAIAKSSIDAALARVDSIPTDLRDWAWDGIAEALKGEATGDLQAVLLRIRSDFPVNEQADAIMTVYSRLSITDPDYAMELVLDAGIASFSNNAVEEMLYRAAKGHPAVGFKLMSSMTNPSNQQVGEFIHDALEITDAGELMRLLSLYPQTEQTHQTVLRESALGALDYGAETTKEIVSQVDLSTLGPLAVSIVDRMEKIGYDRKEIEAMEEFIISRAGGR